MAYMLGLDMRRAAPATDQFTFYERTLSFPIWVFALGLIIGGAIGNAIDRFAYGAVVDFALFHVQIGGKTFNWYVFNLADAAIVAGVAALLYDSFLGVPAAKAP